MGLFFYNIFLLLYAAGIRVASLFNKKAKARLVGASSALGELEKWKAKTGDNIKLIWIHCASLGEFEQGRPLIEKIRQQYAAYRIILTFFSPSGYTIRKDYTGADAVFYLPADGKNNAERFIGIIKPSLVIWVKYEYWFHYLTSLKRHKIPVILVSAIFREDQPFFKWYGAIWKQMLNCFAQIFVQDENSLDLLKQHGLSANVVVAGDTRFDRVIDIAEKYTPLPTKLIDFCEGHKVIVAGSTWEEDEEEIVHYAKMHPKIRFIVAPHEIDEERLADAKKLFKDAVLYSEFIYEHKTAQVLIIDNIGMLSRLYTLADITYIGGGFNDSGIHNILEAAVYKKPIVFGPVYEKFKEARDLVERGSAFSIENALELEALLDKLFNDDELLMETVAISGNYVYEHRGATENILGYLYANRLLTN